VLEAFGRREASAVRLVYREYGKLVYAVAYHVLGPGGGIDVELVESRPGGGWSAPRRLSARTMRPEWLPNTTSGRMLADYISVHYAGPRPLAVWVLASQPVGTSLRQAVYASRG